jgi:hypothetical protein
MQAGLNSRRLALTDILSSGGFSDVEECPLRALQIGMKDNWETHPPVREITSDMGKPVRGQGASQINRILKGVGDMVWLNRVRLRQPAGAFFKPQCTFRNRN